MPTPEIELSRASLPLADSREATRNETQISLNLVALRNTRYFPHHLVLEISASSDLLDSEVAQVVKMPPGVQDVCLVFPP